jgi:hypothetical protein
MTNSETAAVTVNADDQRPVVQIYSPSLNEKVVGNNFSASGGARDNSYVAGVWYRMNSGTWSTARTSDSWQNWIADISPTNGMNVLSVYAVDSVGNVSFTNSLMFKAEIKGELDVVVNGPGKVKPPQAVQYLDLGSPCKLTAVPTKGYIFSGWTVDVQSINTSITFALTNNMAVQANFVPNPFSRVKGRYEGSVSSTPSLPARSSNSMKAQVLENGSFVLKLKLGGNQYHYSGKFAADGTANFNVEKKGISIINVNLQLDLNGGNALRADIGGSGVTAIGVATKQGK